MNDIEARAQQAKEGSQSLQRPQGQRQEELQGFNRYYL